MKNILKGKILLYIPPLLLVSWICACSNSVQTDDQTNNSVLTPVTVTSIGHEDMSDYIELNATSTFLLKNFVKANANGYLHSSSIHLGQSVKRGQLLFTVKTKEAESLGSTLNVLDSSFKFSGTNKIRAGESGFVNQLNHQTGDYVQDGEQLATISDMNSFVFLMNLPYEYSMLAIPSKKVEIYLPNGEQLIGTIGYAMPQMDSVAQTQQVVVKVVASHSIPENLVAKVRLLKKARPNATTLPKAAILSDESQTNYWIMKVANNAIAIKTPIKKGIETAQSVEILSPLLSDSDRILLTGNYGLEDSAKIKITKPTE
ncbi:efflux RND transporter periplasmic adaptor subunit [Olivibacter sp. CPCC 100613]|uniref:efflux RND transporter periplasmic adaptor subunit n=1 Tax=Olivibacter sp. CPCC 100613 TaxID=3079931 RepID=UPI002FF474FB